MSQAELPTITWNTFTNALRELSTGPRRGYGAAGYSFLTQIGLASFKIYNLPPRPPLPADAGGWKRLRDWFERQAAEANRREWKLTEMGMAVHNALYIYNDTEVARSLLAKAALRHPIIALLARIFSGRGKVKIHQVRELFRLESIWAPDESTRSFLELCHELGVISLHKRWYTCEVLAIPDTTAVPDSYFIHPLTPYSNRQYLIRVLSSLTGSVIWADKHFSRHGIDFIMEGVRTERVKSVAILSGPEHVADSRGAFAAAKEQLAHAGLALEWRVVRDSGILRKWHDRWLIDDCSSYNMPPVNAIAAGQYSQIIRSDMVPKAIESIIAAGNVMEV